MSCPKTQYLLTEYVAGDLPRVVRDEIEGHLAECESCAAELEKIQQAQVFLSQWQEEDVPHWDRAIAGFRHDRATGQNSNGGWISRWLPSMLSFTMLVVLVLNTSVTRSDGDYRISFNSSGADVLQAQQNLESAALAQDQAVQILLETLQQRQDVNNIRVMQTLVDYTEQLSAENFERIYAYFEQQRRLDLENVQNSYQQLVASDFETMRSMQQLANFVRDQGEAR